MQNGIWLGMLITKQSSLFYWNHYIFSSIFSLCIWIGSVVDFFSIEIHSNRFKQLVCKYWLTFIWIETLKINIENKTISNLGSAAWDTVQCSWWYRVDMKLQKPHWFCPPHANCSIYMSYRMGYDMICYDMTIVWYGWQAVAILWNVIKYKMWECGKRYKQACFGMIKTAKHSTIQPNYKDKGHFQWQWQQPQHIERQRRTKQCHHITHESR